MGYYVLFMLYTVVHHNCFSFQGSSPANTVMMAKVTENSQFNKCDVCQKYFNSSLQLQDHMHGKSHQQKAQKRLENNLGITDPGTINPGNFNPGTMNPGNVNPGTMNPGNVNPETMNPGKSYPESSNQETFTPHIGTLNGAIKSETMVVPSLEVTNVGKNLSDLFCCKRCNITLNSKKQLEQHNKGLRHKIIIGKAQPPSVGGMYWFRPIMQDQGQLFESQVALDHPQDNNLFNGLKMIKKL